MGYSNTVTYSLLVEGLFWFDLVFSLKFVCCFIIQHFSFLIDFYYFNYMCVHVCGFVYMSAVYQWRPKGGARWPGAGVTGDCEPPNMVLRRDL